jgi:hypothetical protein
VHVGEGQWAGKCAAGKHTCCWDNDTEAVQCTTMYLTVRPLDTLCQTLIEYLECLLLELSKQDLTGSADKL